MRTAETKRTYADPDPGFISLNELDVYVDVKELLDARADRIVNKVRAGIPLEAGKYRPYLKPDGSLAVEEVEAKCNQQK